MKLNRNNIFITISSIALIMVLIIQINWILETAKIKEEFFNEKANMVLSRTTEALSADNETCGQIGARLKIDSTVGSGTKLGTKEAQKIDSLFNHYMNFYNFHIDYSFEIVKPVTKLSIGMGFANYSYNKPLQAAAIGSGVELKLIFPEKKQFIIAEMGTLFITSVVLILIVLFMFWRTITSLVKEKKISEHTTDFLNNMTHEFKTPLTNIALASKMLIKDTNIKQEDKIKHYSGVILEENEKLRLQVEQVLSMTALERGEIPLQKVVLDFHQLLNNSLKHISLQIENKRGMLVSKFNATNAAILGDKTHLTNAICNLIDNSIKYAGKEPKIIIETINVSKHLIIKILDNGIGIEKQFQQKVFNKFFRVPTGDLHDVKGFGLGLAYVKKIIELHSGTIELVSEKQKGTKFIITLPNA